MSNVVRRVGSLPTHGERCGTGQNGRLSAKTWRIACLISAIADLGWGAAYGAQPFDEVGRAWQPSDSLSVRYFTPDIGSMTVKDPPITFSPDGRYFYVQSWHGELQEDVTVQTLEFFETSAVKRWLAEKSTTPHPPRMSFERKLYGRSKPGAILSPRWNEAGTAITFIGFDAQEQRQIYRLEVPSGVLQTLTDDEDGGKAAYEVDQNGEALLYGTLRARPINGRRPYPALLLPRNQAGELAFKSDDFDRQLLARYKGGETWALPIESSRFKAWFSPDSARAVVLALPSRSTDQQEGESPRASGTFLLVDFAQRAARRLSEANAGADDPVKPQAMWSPDGQHVILVNTRLPDEVGSPSSGDLAESYIAAYNSQSHGWQLLQPMQETLSTRGVPKVRQVQGVQWRSAHELLLTYSIDNATAGRRSYKRQDDRWVAQPIQNERRFPTRPTVAKPTLGLEVKVRQSPNDPPTVVVSNGRVEKTLSRPDPALNGLYRARVEAFSWSLPNGSTMTGGLSLPRTAALPLPVVIQIGYDYDQPEAFAPDGPQTAPFARQALNARGMAVLSLDATVMQRSSDRFTPREGPGIVEQIDSAVDALVRKGLVDRKLVGLVGFSRTGFHTLYAATHPQRTPFAAAVVADSVTYNYAEYLYLGVRGEPIGYERMNGGNFWQSKESWLQHDPIFNLDRMDAATLFIEATTVKGSGEMLDDHHPAILDKIAALERSHRRYDILFITEGWHPVLLPRQRLAEMEATVDWMAFWLLGDEQAAETKVSQYARWRQIRDREAKRKTELKASADAE